MAGLSTPTAPEAQNKPNPAAPTAGSPAAVIDRQASAASNSWQPAQPCEHCEAVLRIGMFFDGTNNNRGNTEERKASGGAIDPSHRYYNSYGNEITNISKLSDVYPKTGSQKTMNNELYIFANIYIEGVGTITGEYDRYFLGSGGDYGETGAVAKAKLGSDKAYEFVKAQSSARKITRVEFDVYGFSRGATSARHFSNMVNFFKGIYHYGYGKETDRYKQVNTKDGKRYIVLKIETKINFIGLYDTVATYGISSTTKKIPAILNLPNKIASKMVYQIVAKDEVRDNFSLISILNTGIAPTTLPKQPRIIIDGIFKEQYVYGVHADVGGGYVDGDSEHSVIARGVGDGKQALIDAKSKSAVPDTLTLTTIPAVMTADTTTPEMYEIASNRKSVNGNLPIVYLHMMRDESVNNGVPFSNIINKDATLPGNLSSIPRKLNNGEQVNSSELKTIQDGTHVSEKKIETTDDIGLGSSGPRVVHPNDQNPRPEE